MNGCLCIHGFTGSPKELEPLVQFLKKHTNWFIKTPTLPGHGEHLRLKGIHYQQWIEHTEMELQQLLEQCDKVYICGFSMGGLIASYLSVRYPVQRLVLLSPAAYYLNTEYLKGQILRYFTFRESTRGIRTEIYTNFKRKVAMTPLSAVLQFRKLVQTIRPLLRQLSTPTFIVQGKQDPVVPEKSAHFLFKSIQSIEKRLLFIEEADHQICYGDYTSQLFHEILSFLDLESVENPIVHKHEKLRHSTNFEKIAFNDI
ncbi:alpha/beta hydrolase [Bacillus kwashiorkori]|uniref:alpha/beta hydrolase n=1 Tax=Bacillus kwashiorkori TaxID=1522318 RepID=UPI0008F8D226|nr:alpha/beta fold hydrolase [Bacillus kwashiorkori]